ncbi:MAG TPA: DUF4401 domain-containing protein [Burkholderiales bacterium]|nr:DUF4401 domain-containing protein [Burkholderiales bacterium]
MSTREETWERLRIAGLVEGETPAPEKTDSPWYVRAMLGVAGWIGALFLLGFVGAGLAFVFKDEGIALVVGLLCCAGAFGIFRIARENNFLTQFGLAVSLAGQVMVGFGLTKLTRHIDSAEFFFMFALFEAALAAFVPNFVHRAWSAFAAVIALSFALALHGAAQLLPGLLAVTLAALWLNEFHWTTRGNAMRAIAYGLTLGLIQVDAQLLFGASSGLWHGRVDGLAIGPWIGPMLAGVALVWTAFRLLRRYAISPRSRVGLGAIIATAMIAAASIQAPGVSAALLIIVLGFANANRTLFGLGVIALLVYLSHFYYQLDITLLVKSGVLTGTGCALLAARYAMSVLFPHARKEQDNA